MTKGGLDMADVKNFASKALKTTGEVAKVVGPLLPMIAMAVAKYKEKGGVESANVIAGGGKKKGSKRLVRKDAPKGVPSQLKPWMRVVETVRADPKHKNKPYKEQLKIAKKIYDLERP